MKIEQNGITIVLVFDEDNFPIINIDTQSGYMSDKQRPSVEVKLNDVMIHNMFDHDDTDDRWEYNHMKIIQRTAYSRMSVKGNVVPFCYVCSLSGARNNGHSILVENVFGFSSSFGKIVLSFSGRGVMSSR